MRERPAVTIEVLSRVKRLPADVLRSYGLIDCDEGVLFTYRLPNGQPGRPRLRSAMRGSDGSAWWHPDIWPITAYTAPPHVIFRESPNLIIVEGESDCWTAWTHGIAAVGIPGSDRTGAIASEHVRNIGVVFIQREDIDGETKTYPRGVDHFVASVASQLCDIGYLGEVRVLEMPKPYSDLSDMYIDAPDVFATRLSSAMVRAGLYQP